MFESLQEGIVVVEEGGSIEYMNSLFKGLFQSHEAILD